MSKETSHRLSPGREGREGMVNFVRITWFSGGTEVDQPSLTEYELRSVEN